MINLEFEEYIKNEANYDYIFSHSHEFNWNEISNISQLPNNFLYRFRNFLNWSKVNKCNDIPEDLIKILISKLKLNWEEVSECQKHLSEEFIKKHFKKLNIFWISVNYNLSPTFMREYKDYFDLVHYIKSFPVKKDFLLEFKDEIINMCNADDWNYIAHNNFPVYYYEIFKDQLNWEEVSKSNEPFSADFLNKFGRYLNWNTCLHYKYFKMKFIKKYWKRFNFNWRILCSYQQLSEDFIRKHKDKIYWEELTFKSTLPLTLIEDMSPYFNKRCWSNISFKQRLTREFVFNHLEQIDLPAFIQNYKIKWNKEHAVYALELIDRKRTGL